MPMYVCTLRLLKIIAPRLKTKTTIMDDRSAENAGAIVCALLKKGMRRRVPSEVKKAFFGKSFAFLEIIYF